MVKFCKPAHETLKILVLLVLPVLLTTRQCAQPVPPIASAADANYHKRPYADSLQNYRSHPLPTHAKCERVARERAARMGATLRRCI